VPVCYDAHWIGYKLGSGTGTTAGQAAAKLYSLTVAGDAVQTTAASQPLLLAHSGVDNYWWGSGVAGNYVSTPNAAVNRITGDIEIIAKIKFNSFTGSQEIVCKWDATRGYNLLIQAKKVAFYFTQDGSSLLSVNSTIDLPFSLGDIGWVKATRIASTGIVTFYSSTDGITYTILGAALTYTTGAMYSSNSILEIGSSDSGLYTLGKNSIYRATIANSIGGTPVVDFNPATYNASTSQTAWTSTTGEVWTINKSTGLSFAGQLVNRTYVMGGALQFMTNSTTSLRPNNCTQYISYSNNNNDASSNRLLIDSNSSNWLNSITGGYLGISEFAMNGFASSLNRSGMVLGSLSLITVKTNAGIENSMSRNNGTLATNSFATTPSGNGLTLLARNAGLTPIAAVISSYICSSSVDTTDQQTATYNLIRSLNENAF
jgi:hypothetical protein